MKGKINRQLTAQLAISVGICVLLSYILAPAYYQTMTACIASLLCTQDTPVSSWKAGLIRLLITFIGGVAGIGVVGLDLLFDNFWIFVILCAAGVFVTIMLCGIANTPAISARIGAVTFVLVTLTRKGTDRIFYAAFRFASTLCGVLVVMLVTAAFAAWKKCRAVHGC